MYDMPLSDAVLVENGAFTRVSRIARAIETIPALSTQYKKGKLTQSLVDAAIAHLSSASGYGTFEGQGAGFTDKAARRRAKLGGPGSFAAKLEAKSFGARNDSKVRVTGSDRRRIAKYLGVLTAYDNAMNRKKILRTAALGQGSGFAFTSTEITRKDGKPGKRKKFEKGMKPVYERTDDRAARSAARSAAAADAAYQQLLYGTSISSQTGKPVMADIARRAKRKEIRKSAGDFAAAQVQYDAYLASVRQPLTLAQKRHIEGLRASVTRRTPGSRHQNATKLTEALKLAKTYKDQGMSWDEAKIKASNELGVRLAGTPARSNPFHGLGDLALVTNPSGIALLDSVEGAVAGVPVVGAYIAPLITPAALGAAAFGVHFFAVPYVEKYLPDMAKPYAYTIGGSAVGIISGVVAAKTSDATVRNAASLIGGAAVAIGVGLDLFRKYGGGATAGDDDFGAVALENRGSLGAVALENSGMFGAVALENSGMFGDGMAYQLAPVSLGFDGESAALQNAYGRASLADAYFSGPDFDAVEGEALLNGASEFGRVAGSVPYGAAGEKKHHSAYAGRRFHRWGWLIKLVGFQNAQQIASLPPEERLKVINELRKQALATYQAHVAGSGSQSGLPTGIGPMGPAAPAAAPGVGDSFGYGALAVADY
jgi:hypothetical protein